MTFQLPYSFIIRGLLIGALLTPDKAISSNYHIRNLTEYAIGILVDDPDVHINNVTGLNLDILNQTELIGAVSALHTIGYFVFDISTYHLHGSLSIGVLNHVADSLETEHANIVCINFELTHSGIYNFRCVLRGNGGTAGTIANVVAGRLVESLCQDRINEINRFSGLYDAEYSGLQGLLDILSGELDETTFFTGDETKKTDVPEIELAWLAPSAIPVKVKTQGLSFFENPVWHDENTTAHAGLKGAVYEIHVGGQTYSARHDKNGTFTGYYNALHKKWYESAEPMYRTWDKPWIAIGRIIDNCASYIGDMWIYEITIPVNTNRSDGLIRTFDEIENDLNSPYNGPISYTHKINVCLPKLYEAKLVHLKPGNVIYNPTGSDYGAMWDIGNGTQIYLGIADDGSEYYLIYTENTQRWQAWAPDPGCEICNDLSGLMLELVKLVPTSLHVGLQVGGLVPGVGEVFDIADGLLYLIEGNETEAAISFGAAIAIVGWEIRGGQWALKLKKATNEIWGGLIRKSSGGGTEVISISNVSAKFDELGFDKYLVDKFRDDWNSVEGLGKAFIGNPELVSAWKILSDLPSEKAWVRQNPDIVEIMESLGTDIAAQNRLKNLYRTFSPNGPFPDTRHGVYFNKYGFPDFTEYSAPITNKKYFSENLEGNGQGSSDFVNAANWFVSNNPNATLASGGKGIVVDGQYYSMHHMEDGKTIIPVLGSKHGEVGHTGGGSIIRNELKGLFEID